MNLQQTDMLEYRSQLEKGSIQRAYRGLMDFMMGLRTHFQKTYPQYSVPGSLYAGYMDMTYFSIVPEIPKEHGLKIAVVFLHEAFRFEVWLSGYNRPVQEDYWRRIRESGWNKYHLVTEIKGSDSIVEHILVENPDFSDPDALTARIDKGVVVLLLMLKRFLLRINRHPRKRSFHA
jgi:hypothetical protein